MTKIQDLISNFNIMVKQYRANWKAKKYDVCQMLKTNLATLAEELRKLGVAIGMSPENLAYLQNSLSTCTRTATDAETVACLLRDVEGVFKTYEQPTEQKGTFRGFDKYLVNEDGSLSLPVPEEPEKIELPDHPQTRNSDLEKQRRSDEDGA